MTARHRMAPWPCMRGLDAGGTFEQLRAILLVIKK
jgi:hypothetical protein